MEVEWAFSLPSGEEGVSGAESRRRNGDGCGLFLQKNRAGTTFLRERAATEVAVKTPALAERELAALDRWRRKLRGED